MLTNTRAQAIAKARFKAHACITIKDALAQWAESVPECPIPAWINKRNSKEVDSFMAIATGLFTPLPGNPVVAYVQDCLSKLP